jgi:hypothetical protein
MGRIHAILSDGTVVTDVEVWLLTCSLLIVDISLAPASVI